jgi:phage shock protein PspC (stress-responsive transcriptional regulator)
MLCPYCRSENAPGATRCAACTSWLVEVRPVREWTRARTGRLIAGVARGLATRFGLPVAAARLIFLLSVLLGGWGILVYVALWIAMPLEQVALPAGATPPSAEPEPRLAR